MEEPPFLLPGATVPAHLLPNTKPSKTASSSTPVPLKLGPGLRHIPPSSTVTPTVAGQLYTDARKRAVWIESLSSGGSGSGGGRYTPTQNDQVIATIHHSSTDYYHCSLTPYTPLALLPQLAFESATKKTRPQLIPGSLVYARISQCSKHTETEVECVDASTGKAEGMGELKGGMVFEISLGMARRLMMAGTKGGLVVLEEVGAHVPFEMAVGRNGRVWVDAVGGDVAGILAVGRAIVETDVGGLGVEGQRALVKRMFKG